MSDRNQDEAVRAKGSITSRGSRSSAGSNESDRDQEENGPPAAPRSVSAIQRRRAAIKVKKVEEIRGHLFAKVYFTKFTFCSVCNKFIWGVTSPQGYRCQNCSKAVHKKCRRDVGDVCTKSARGGFSVMVQERFNVNKPHRYESHTIKSPSFCDHCGNNMGFLTQVKKCKECKLYYHKKCTELVGDTCGLAAKMTAEATRASRASTSSQSSVDETIQPFSANPRDSFPDLGSVFKDLDIKQGARKYKPEDFNFVKVLGKGSFGKVMLAHSTSDPSQYFAIKAMRKDVALDDDDIETAKMERQILVIGTESPFLTNLFCTFQSKTHLFFVMEFLNGGDLLYHIQTCGKFPADRARFYCAEVLSGLQFLHREKVVYRDLKLDNILLDRTGHVKIADFGMCKKLSVDKEKTSTFCGTPDYIAPEIILGKKYSYSVDYWALGVLTFEMMTGESPFFGNTDDELFQAILKSRIDIPKFIDREARAFIMELLTREVTHRLGVNGEPIRQHPFFRSIDWQKLETKQLTPPFAPRMRTPQDTTYFDKDFLKERVALTPMKKDVLQTIEQDIFKDFTFTNQKLLAD